MMSLFQDSDQSQSKPRERTYGPVVAAFAAILCVGGLGWAGWTVYDTTRPTGRPTSASDLAKANSAASERDIKTNAPALKVAPGETAPQDQKEVVAVAPSGRRMAVAPMGELPIPPKDAVYTPVTNADQATEVLATLSSVIGVESTKIDGLTPTPLQTSDQVSTAVKAFLGPLVQGEIKDAPAYLAANGAKAPDSGPNSAVLNSIASLLKFCDLDTAHTKVRRAPRIQNPMGNMMPKLPPGSISMMINRQDRDDGEGVASLMMPLAGLLPEADVGIAENAARIEVLIPAKLKDPQFADKSFLVGLILAQNAGKGKWIPEMLQFHTKDVETIKALSRTIKPRTGSSDGGSPAPKAPSDRN